MTTTLAQRHDAWQRAKAATPAAIILHRIGDFAETFDGDARTCAERLGLTLTRRGDVLLAGFPWHDRESYLAELDDARLRVLLDDGRPQYPLDPPGYAWRVAALEAVGLTTSDAQGLADVEFAQLRPV